MDPQELIFPIILCSVMAMFYNPIIVTTAYGKSGILHIAFIWTPFCLASSFCLTVYHSMNSVVLATIPEFLLFVTNLIIVGVLTTVIGWVYYKITIGLAQLLKI